MTWRKVVTALTMLVAATNASASEDDDPALLARRAQELHFQGETATGREYLHRAEKLAPHDIDIRTLGDRMWLGEARLRFRNDIFPSGWDNIPYGELSLLQRFGRAMVGVRTEQSQRPATVVGKSEYNAFYAASFAYTLGVGWVAGVEGGFGAPARAVPEALGRGFLYFPIAYPLDGYAAYTFMTFASGARVHVVNPIVGLQITDALRVEARYWLARVSADGVDPRVVHSVGGRVLYRVAPRVALDAFYVYGTQLDRVPAAFQLLDVRSHIASLAVDALLVRSFGLRPQYQLELRKIPNGEVLTIHSAELAVYVRW